MKESPARFLIRFWISGLSLVLTTMQAQSQKRVHPSSPDVGRIRHAVTSAKARGETAVQLPSAIIMPTGVTSVDEVLSSYSVMLLEPSQIVVSDDPHSIFTWYKFRILDTLTRQKEVSKDTLPEDVPEELLPVADKEVLLVESGGRVLIDGITITQGSPHDLRFMLRRQYLVCLYLESEGKIATLAAHINGVFVVQNDNTFVSLSKHDDPLARDFQRRYGNDLTVMREQVKQRSR